MKKMARSLFALACLSLTTLAQSTTSFATCYRLSSSPDTNAPRGETMCIGLESKEENLYTISFYSGYNEMRTHAATLHVKLLSRSRCMDCNEDVYGDGYRGETPFSVFKVEFHGKRKFGINDQIMETGAVKVGNTQLYYRGPVQEVSL